MKYSNYFRTVRAVEREAAACGYHGDIWTDDVPPLGTLRQELAAVAIALEAGSGAATSAGDRKLRKQLARAAVLTSPEPAVSQPKPKTRRRAWTSV